MTVSLIENPSAAAAADDPLGRAVVLASATLNPEVRAVLTRILRRIADLEATQGVDVAEAALMRVIDALGPRRPPLAH